MKITVEKVVRAGLEPVWDAWNNPADIKQWNTAQDDWHTTRSTVDLREGGKFKETFDAENENPAELQRQGWQAILDNFGRYVEAKAG